MKKYPLPVLGFCAWSGTGKTTLLTKLLPLLHERDLRIGVIKHAHHTFDIDYPGKDSYELRKAGATQMLVASRTRTALISEPDDPTEEPRLFDLLDALDTRKLDLVLVEGFKQEAYPKIELHRPSLGHPLMCGSTPQVVAVASDEPVALPSPVPLLDLNQPREIAEFILRYRNQYLQLNVS